MSDANTVMQSSCAVRYPSMQPGPHTGMLHILWTAMRASVTPSGAHCHTDAAPSPGGAGGLSPRWFGTGLLHAVLDAVWDVSRLCLLTIPQVQALAALEGSPHVVRYYSAWIEPQWERLGQQLMRGDALQLPGGGGAGPGGLVAQVGRAVEGRAVLAPDSLKWPLQAVRALSVVLHRCKVLHLTAREIMLGPTGHPCSNLLAPGPRRRRQTKRTTANLLSPP